MKWRSAVGGRYEIRRNSQAGRVFVNHRVWSDRDNVFFNSNHKRFIIGRVNDSPPYFRCSSCGKNYESLTDFREHDCGKRLHCQKAFKAKCQWDLLEVIHDRNYV